MASTSTENRAEMNTNHGGTEVALTGAKNRYRRIGALIYSALNQMVRRARERSRLRSRRVFGIWRYRSGE